MTLQTIADAFALNIGVEQTTAVITSPDRTWREMVSMSNLVGDELARRADWGALTTTQVIAGDSTDRSFALSGDVSRIVRGSGVVDETNIYRPLTRSEWNDLPVAVGFPRYFLFEGNRISFWPYMLTGFTTTVIGQTRNWCDNGTNKWNADTDTSLIDENLMLLGLLVRWRRQKGMDFSDYEAEYEAALSDAAGFDDRSRL